MKISIIVIILIAFLCLNWAYLPVAQIIVIAAQSRYALQSTPISGGHRNGTSEVKVLCICDLCESSGKWTDTSPLKHSNESVNPSRRRRWKRSSIELNGRFEPTYQHEMSGLLIHSYSHVGAFPHLYHVDGVTCQSLMHRLASEANISPQMPFRKQGISAVDFDNKGIYLVSVTKSDCLTVHDFEGLYCQIHELACLEEDATPITKSST